MSSAAELTLPARHDTMQRFAGRILPRVGVAAGVESSKFQVQSSKFMVDSSHD
jgi:hypothetical protein